MGLLDQIENFESQPISTIVFNMIKWFEFDDVNINYYFRDNVESGVWIAIKIKKGENVWWVDGQRNDIVRRRLAEWLKNYLEKQRNK